MDSSIAIEGFRLMVESRCIDDACKRVLDTGRDVPNYHAARGQEALYAGAGMALRAQDFLLYNYRAFATLRAKGIPLQTLMSDLMLTAEGTNKGHGGIMHVTSPDNGIVGRNGVFGSKFGIGVGLALSARLQGSDAVVLSMFGEAEGNRGGLYEALNIATLRKLPVVFLAENNGFAVAARTPDLYAGGNMSDLFRGFPIPVNQVDGNDFTAVFDAVSAAVAHGRAGNGPSYVECVTYRVDPHHGHDDDSLYRDTNELAEWKRHDPIERAAAELIAQGTDPGSLGSLRAEAKASVDAAMEKALVGPEPTLDGLFGRVYFSGEREMQDATN